MPKKPQSIPEKIASPPPAHPAVAEQDSGTCSDPPPEAYLAWFQGTAPFPGLAELGEFVAQNPDL